MSFTKADGSRIEIVFSEIVSPLTPVIGQKFKIPLFTTITTLNQNSTYSAINLIDGDVSTYWSGNTAINWINIQLEKPRIAKGFRWYIQSSTYYPKTFTVSGSNDGQNWVLLSDVLTGTSTIGWQAFTFTNDTAYLQYRVNILTAGHSYYIYIAEIELYLNYGNEEAFTVIVPEYDFVPGGSIEHNKRIVESIENKTGYSNLVDLSDGDLNGIAVNRGVLTLEEAVLDG